MLVCNSPGLSQLTTSFFAFQTLGIHHVPLFALKNLPLSTRYCYPVKVTRFLFTTFYFPICQRTSVQYTSPQRKRLPTTCRCSGPTRRGNLSSGPTHPIFSHKELFADPRPLLRPLSSLSVEDNGFEPLTPCVQGRCSSQLS